MKSEPSKELFVNRDISWLEFNSRVLDEAADRGNPLLERLKFLSIFSSNLDEFFMVRIAGINQQLAHRFQKIYKDYGYVPTELLSQLDQRIRVLVERQYRYLNREILPALSTKGISLISWKELNSGEKLSLQKMFQQEILPILTPVAIDPSHPFPFISNLSLELLVRVIRLREGQERFAIVEVPHSLPRFIQVSSKEDNQMTFIAAEEVISNNLAVLFNGCEIRECVPFRVTRDMDFSIDEESIEDLVSEMRTALQKKGRRNVVRLEIASAMTKKSRTWLMDKLAVKPNMLYSIPGPINLKAVFQIASVNVFPDLIEPEYPPLSSIRADDKIPIVDTIRENGPFIIHLPYESFHPVVRFLEEAADDPNVLAIKQTLYRVSGNSPIVKALIRAARNGKQVSVLFEIKARFDEENNINWARELAEAGAHVVYGIAGLKVHCKALMIIRREETGIERYVHLSTGNYNDKTAKLYTDIGYFSNDKLLAADVASLFNVITGFSDPPQWNKLFVAPFNLKEKLFFLIDREAHLSTKENPGHITMKINSLIDYEMIEHLYEAAKHHVKIDLIVRGICGINPYSLPPEFQQNIRVVSILDRFLEHARIYIFKNNDSPEYYMGSSDLMPRNLRRRIELLFPVEEKQIRTELDFIVKTALADQRKGRRMTNVNRYSRTISNGKYEKTRSQTVLYEFYRERFRLFQESMRPGKRKLTVY